MVIRYQCCKKKIRRHCKALKSFSDVITTQLQRPVVANCRSQSFQGDFSLNKILSFRYFGRWSSHKTLICSSYWLFWNTKAPWIVIRFIWKIYNITKILYLSNNMSLIIYFFQRWINIFVIKHMNIWCTLNYPILYL